MLMRNSTKAKIFLEFQNHEFYLALETVDLQVFRAGQRDLLQKGLDGNPLVSLELEDLTVLFVHDDGAVTGKLFLAGPGDFSGGKGLGFVSDLFFCACLYL